MPVVQLHAQKPIEKKGVIRRSDEALSEKLARRGPRILLVNSSAEVSDVIAKVLRKIFTSEGFGHSLESTESGIEAVRRCTEERIDVVVTGLLPKELSGIEAIRQIREKSPETKIIVLSGIMKTQQIVFDAFEAGAISFFDKLDLFHEAPVLAARIKELSATKIE